jgi:hypothetical protein
VVHGTTDVVIVLPLLLLLWSAVALCITMWVRVDVARQRKGGRERSGHVLITKAVGKKMCRPGIEPSALSIEKYK